MELQPTKLENQPNTETEVDSDILELVPGFCVSRKKDLTELGSYLLANDFASIAKVSHTIKGVARPYGFPSLESYAINLEKAAKANDNAQCTQILNAMRTYFKAYTQ